MSNTSSESGSEFFMGTIFYEDSNEELVPGLTEESSDETGRVMILMMKTLNW